MKNIETRPGLAGHGEAKEEKIEEKNSCWLEIPELDANRKFFFPRIIKQPEKLNLDANVEFQINPEGETRKLSIAEYFKYIGFRTKYDRKKIYTEFLGADRYQIPELINSVLPTILEKLPEIWKKHLIERRKISQKLEKMRSYSSSTREDIKETIEKAFIQLLNDSGYFDEVKLVDTVNDFFEKCDVVVKLEDKEDEQGNIYEKGGYLAIQHTVLSQTEKLTEKEKKIFKIGKITLPEHLELGEMPLVIIKDNYLDYMREGQPLVKDYKEKLQAKPDFLLWKLFKNRINKMLAEWFDQIIHSLNEEMNIHPTDRDFYLKYLEKIRLLAEEHKKTRQN